MSLRIDRFRYVDSIAASAAVLLAGLCALPALALPSVELRTYTSTFLYDAGPGVDSEFQDLYAPAGPLTAAVEAGLNLTYPYPGYEGVLQDVEATLNAKAAAETDFGVHKASLGMYFDTTDGTDRGKFPSGQFSGTLPFNSTLEPQASVQSSWTDTFTISGGTGVGTGSVHVLIHGHATSEYFANGTFWYGNPSFYLFGNNGRGSAQYGLDILYDSLPAGLDPEYNQPIRWQQDYSPPLLDSIQEIGPTPYELVIGTFVFEYDVPFALQSNLTLAGYNQITIEFDHTISVAGFELSPGDSISAGSGHTYALVPEPTTATLVVVGLGLLAGTPRTRSSARRSIPDSR